MFLSNIGIILIVIAAETSIREERVAVSKELQKLADSKKHIIDTKTLSRLELKETILLEKLRTTYQEEINELMVNSSNLNEHELAITENTIASLESFRDTLFTTSSSRTIASSEGSGVVSGDISSHIKEQLEAEQTKLRESISKLTPGTLEYARATSQLLLNSQKMTNLAAIPPSTVSEFQVKQYVEDVAELDRQELSLQDTDSRVAIFNEREALKRNARGLLEEQQKALQTSLSKQKPGTPDFLKTLLEIQTNSQLLASFAPISIEDHTRSLGGVENSGVVMSSVSRTDQKAAAYAIALVKSRSLASDNLQDSAAEKATKEKEFKDSLAAEIENLKKHIDTSKNETEKKEILAQIGIYEETLRDLENETWISPVTKAVENITSLTANRNQFDNDKKQLELLRENILKSDGKTREDYIKAYDSLRSALIDSITANNNRLKVALTDNPGFLEEDKRAISKQIGVYEQELAILQKDRTSRIPTLNIAVALLEEEIKQLQSNLENEKSNEAKESIRQKIMDLNKRIAPLQMLSSVTGDNRLPASLDNIDQLQYTMNYWKDKVDSTPLVSRDAEAFKKNYDDAKKALKRALELKFKLLTGKNISDAKKEDISPEATKLYQMMATLEDRESNGKLLSDEELLIASTEKKIKALEDKKSLTTADSQELLSLNTKLESLLKTRLDKLHKIKDLSSDEIKAAVLNEIAKLNDKDLQAKKSIDAISKKLQPDQLLTLENELYRDFFEFDYYTKALMNAKDAPSRTSIEKDRTAVRDRLTSEINKKLESLKKDSTDPMAAIKINKYNAILANLITGNIKTDLQKEIDSLRGLIKFWHQRHAKSDTTQSKRELLATTKQLMDKIKQEQENLKNLQGIYRSDSPLLKDIQSRIKAYDEELAALQASADRLSLELGEIKPAKEIMNQINLAQTDFEFWLRHFSNASTKDQPALEVRKNVAKEKLIKAIDAGIKEMEELAKKEGGGSVKESYLSAIADLGNRKEILSQDDTKYESQKEIRKARDLRNYWIKMDAKPENPDSFTKNRVLESTKNLISLLEDEANRLRTLANTTFRNDPEIKAKLLQEAVDIMESEELKNLRSDLETLEKETASDWFKKSVGEQSIEKYTALLNYWHKKASTTLKTGDSPYTQKWVEARDSLKAALTSEATRLKSLEERQKTDAEKKEIKDKIIKLEILARSITKPDFIGYLESENAEKITKVKKEIEALTNIDSKNAFGSRTKKDLLDRNEELLLLLENEAQRLEDLATNAFNGTSAENTGIRADLNLQVEKLRAESKLVQENIEKLKKDLEEEKEEEKEETPSDDSKTGPSSKPSDEEDDDGGLICEASSAVDELRDQLSKASSKIDIIEKQNKELSELVENLKQVVALNTANQQQRAMQQTMPQPMQQPIVIQVGEDRNNNDMNNLFTMLGMLDFHSMINQRFSYGNNNQSPIYNFYNNGQGGSQGPFSHNYALNQAFPFPNFNGVWQNPMYGNNPSVQSNNPYYTNPAIQGNQQGQSLYGNQPIDQPIMTRSDGNYPR